VTIDDDIKAKRLELQELKRQEEARLAELHALFLSKAQSLCPIQIGTKVEYQPGKFGQVDRIGYDVNFWSELDVNTEVHWTVTGRKINKTGEYGVKDFSPVGPASHKVNGTSFVQGGIGHALGLDEDDA
jgi:hypothetical protein